MIKDYVLSLYETYDHQVILPALAVLSIVLLIIQKLFLKIRTKFPITVNCWFCNSNTKIAFNSSNSWYCPHCDQYNGFTPDGGYNRLLPEQFNENMNRKSFSKKTKQKSPVSNGLCRFCNINLEQKVFQLSRFVPFDKDNYDEEVQQYSDQLERVYQLCNRCQGVLKKTLQTQETFIATQNKPYLSKFHPTAKKEVQETQNYPIYTTISTILSLGLLVTVLPYKQIYSVLPSNMISALDSVKPWVTQVREYIPYTTTVGELPTGTGVTAVLAVGVVAHLCELVHIRRITTLVNLLLWILLLSLTQVPIRVDGLVTVAHILGSIVFLITALLENRIVKIKSVAAVKPVQLRKLDKTQENKQRKTPVIEEEPTVKPTISQSSVSNQPPVIPSPVSFGPEDFGFGSLSVSPKRITRSQTKHFSPKQFGSQSESDMFKPKFNLTPPKLNIDSVSSTSSGFVSLSHQKDYYRTPSPSVIDENIESVSQCGENLITPYPGFPPTSFSQPYSMHMSSLSHFPPYTVWNFSHPFYNKFEYSNMMAIEPSSSFSLNTQSKVVSWSEFVKNVLSSLTFLVLITTNIAVLWTAFGKNYFRVNSET